MGTCVHCRRQRSGAAQLWHRHVRGGRGCSASVHPFPGKCQPGQAPGAPEPARRRHQQAPEGSVVGMDTARPPTVFILSRAASAGSRSRRTCSRAGSGTLRCCCRARRLLALGRLPAGAEYRWQYCRYCTRYSMHSSTRCASTGSRKPMHTCGVQGWELAYTTAFVQARTRSPARTEVASCHACWDPGPSTLTPEAGRLHPGCCCWISHPGSCLEHGEKAATLLQRRGVHPRQQQHQRLRKECIQEAKGVIPAMETMRCKVLGAALLPCQVLSGALSKGKRSRTHTCWAVHTASSASHSRRAASVGRQPRTHHHPTIRAAVAPSAALLAPPSPSPSMAWHTLVSWRQTIST